MLATLDLDLKQIERCVSARLNLARAQFKERAAEGVITGLPAGPMMIAVSIFWLVVLCVALLYAFWYWLRLMLPPSYAIIALLSAASLSFWLCCCKMWSERLVASEETASVLPAAEKC